MTIKFWSNDIGVIVLPSIDGKQPFIDSWKEFQTRYPNPEESAIIEQRLKAATLIQIILWDLYFDGKPTGYRLTAYDLDNPKAIEEFCNFNGKQLTLEQLVDMGFLVELSQDGKRAHVYVITKEPLRDRELTPKDGKGKDSENEPMIEVKATSKHLMTVALDDDKNKRYYFLGNYKKFGNMKVYHNAATLEAHIDRIEQKYGYSYSFSNGNRFQNYKDPARVLIDTIDGKAYKGIRNDALYKYNCYVLKIHWDTKKPEEIKQMVIDTNQNRCVPPLIEKDIETIWSSALKFIGEQIEIEKVNGNGNDNNNKKPDNEKYEELRGNVYYRTNKRPTKYIIADALTHQVIEVQLKAKVKSVSELQIESNTVECYLRHNRAFLACIPIKIIRHKNPLTFLQLQETFTIVFVDEMGEHYTFSHKTLSAIIQSLKEKALVINDGADSALSSIIQGFKQRNLIEINEELGCTGFFKVNDKILASKLEIKEPSIDKLTDALIIIFSE